VSHARQYTKKYGSVSPNQHLSKPFTRLEISNENSASSSQNATLDGQLELETLADEVDEAVEALERENASLRRERDAAVGDAATSRDEMVRLRRQLEASWQEQHRLETERTQQQQQQPPSKPKDDKQATTTTSPPPADSTPHESRIKPEPDASNLEKEVHSSNKYLLQLVKLCDKRLLDHTTAPLLRVLTKSRFQHAKELSENFGAVNALRKAVDGVGLAWSNLVKKGSRVNVYVPGDGRRPYTAAAVALTTPAGWRVWSIDPLMMADFCASEAKGKVLQAKGNQHDPLGGLRERLTCIRGLTEDFAIPESATREAGGSKGKEALTLSIILAVHSHCPLAEMVARIPPPWLCISMPCCGTCGKLEGEPAMRYTDHDVLSAAREVIVHYQPKAEMG